MPGGNGLKGFAAAVTGDSRTVFVTGTDTGVGKTRVACALLTAHGALGRRCVGFKPVASGAEATPVGLRNDDALALQLASHPAPDYGALNPYCFAPAVAPHLAASASGRTIELSVLDAAYSELAGRYDRVIVEGAGGWQVPLTESATFADWVALRGWPVVMVVAMRLGCLNHALLTAESVLRRTTLLGWVANHLPGTPPLAAEMIETLQRRLPAPLLGTLPENVGAGHAARILAQAAASG